MAEIILDQTQVMPLVRQGEAAGTAQRVGVNTGQAGAFSRCRH